MNSTIIFATHSTFLRWMVRFGLVLLISVLAGSASAQTTYRVYPVDLDASTFADNRPRVNSSGVIAGRVAGQDGYYAARWTFGGGVELIGALPGDLYSMSYGINDLGQIVGLSRPSQPSHRAFLWTPSQGMELVLGFPGSDTAEAWGVNNGGSVVGRAYYNDLGTWRWRAFLRMPNQQLIDIGWLPGHLVSEAVHVNDMNQVVGRSSNGPVERAFYWDAQHGIIDMGLLPGYTHSRAASINNLGAVVGDTWVSNSRRGFVWTMSGGMNDIGALYGWPRTLAYSINDMGQVVGHCTPPNYQTPIDARAFIWSHSEGIIDLNTRVDGSTPGWILVTARSISNGGHITGIGFHDGVQKVFFAEPVVPAEHPSAYFLESGQHLSGNVASLAASDDDHLTTITTHFATPISVRFEATAASGSASAMTFAYEGSTTNPSTTQRLELYDFAAGAWETVDVRPGTTSDSTVTTSPANPSRFVEPGTNRLRARVTLSSGARNARSWQAKTDLVRWTISP
jgi:probable HAF family extracellular repeat protein